MRITVAILGIVLLTILSGLTHTESWVNKMFTGRSYEVHFMHEQLADISWILVLCTFSLLIRYRRRKAARVYLLSLAFFLMTLAALHSHPLWSPGKSRAAESARQKEGITRILSAQVNWMETGLRLDDVVTAMAFDQHGTLWLSTPSNGPYCYLIGPNELENLLRPDVVYGFSPDAEGMWVFTSSGAHLYDGMLVRKSVSFPKGIIPLSAIATPDGHLFGTTRGLYRAAARDFAARHEALQERITYLHSLGRGILATGDNGAWRWTEKGTAAAFSFRRTSLCGLAAAGGSLYSATSDDGILILQPAPVKSVRFALPELNMISPGAVATYRGLPCFGTYDGSVLCRSFSGWKRWKAGDYPVSALASGKDRLYAWSGGRLLDLDLPL